jgi:phosphate acyltransferase
VTGESPTVAVDAFGADRGVTEVAAGASMAAADGIRVRLFGPQAELEDVAAVELCPAEEWITNEEEPVAAVRSKQRASVVMAAADVAEGRSQALVSAGSTGATMAAALFALKRLPGVRRPAIAVRIPLPSGDGRSLLLLDAGANVEVRPTDLVEFACLGAAFSEAVLGVERPRVALLSVGDEASKGPPGLIEAHGTLAAKLGIEFAGNIEGHELLSGSVDVAVTDGFTGNVALKVIEGTAGAVAGAVRDAARSGPLAAAGGLLLRPALAGLRHQLDPNNTGGAILLGLRGVAVVAHGGSTSEGIANAVRLAARASQAGAVDRTARLLRDTQAA